MKIVRQNRSRREEHYDVTVGDREGWDLAYSEFTYPDELDKPRGAVAASLNIVERYPNKFPSRDCPGNTGYFNDTIYLEFDGSVTSRGNEMGVSPVLMRLRRLDELALDKIRSGLSDEAKKLFSRGVAEYTGAEL